MHSTGEKVPVGKDNLLLRECLLKNTDFIEGMVVYAGKESKAMLNNDGPRYKRSKLEMQMNRDVIWCVRLLLFSYIFELFLSILGLFLSIFSPFFVNLWLIFHYLLSTQPFWSNFGSIYGALLDHFFKYLVCFCLLLDNFIMILFFKSLNFRALNCILYCRCVCLLLVMCFMGAIGTAIWLGNFDDYVPFLNTLTFEETEPLFEGFLVFWTFVILLQVIIPMSLYVTIEMTKLCQIYLMHQDAKMWDESCSKGLECRALNIPEELGQVSS